MSKIYNSKYLLLALILTLVVIVTSASAEVPQIINYQGRLTDDSGEPITGSVSVNFKIYDCKSSNNPDNCI